MKRNVMIVAALFLSSLALSQEDTATKSLNEVVVTANKFPQKQNETGKVVTIILQEVIARSAGKTVGELLNQQAGITIVGSQNNPGTNQDVYVRGATAGKTLILIDGIPAYDPSSISTAFDINNFSIDQIERIEIVRGAMSTLYGSDAIGGVINIITKKGSNKPLAIYADLSGGSYNTFKGVAGVNGTVHDNSYNIQYTHLQSQGFSTAYDSTGKMDFDKDAYHQNVLYGSFVRKFSPNVQWKVNGQIGKYKTDLDEGPFTDSKDYTLTSDNYQAGTGVEYQYTKGKLYFNYNVNINEKTFLNDSTIDVTPLAKYTLQHNIGRSHFAELYTNFNLNKHIELLVGTDYRFQNTDQRYVSVSSYGPYESNLNSDSAKMHQNSIYASAFLKELGGFHFEAGGRFNHHSKYGNNLTYTINPSYLINKKVQLFVNIASAFKAPSLYQLFDASLGLPSLQPEESTSYEGGAGYTSLDKKVNVRATYFYRNIKNGIDFNYATYKYFNNNTQKDHGVEVEAAMNLEKLFINANYTYVTGKVNTLKYQYDAANYSYIPNGDTTYNNLFRRPKNAVNATIGYKVTSKWLMSAHARFAGKRNEYQYMAAPVVLNAYQTIDLYTEYQFNKKLKAYLDVKNISNETYFDILGYTSRKRNFMAGLSVNL